MSIEPVPADEPLSTDSDVDDLSALLRLRAAARAERIRRDRRRAALQLYAVRADADRTD